MKVSVLTSCAALCAVAYSASVVGSCTASDGNKIVEWIKSCDSITSSSQAKCDDRNCHNALHRLIEDETVACYVQLGLGSAGAIDKFKPIDAFCHGEGPDPNATPTTTPAATPAPVLAPATSPPPQPVPSPDATTSTPSPDQTTKSPASTTSKPGEGSAGDQEVSNQVSSTSAPSSADASGSGREPAFGMDSSTAGTDVSTETNAPTTVPSSVPQSSASAIISSPVLFVSLVVAVGMNA